MLVLDGPAARALLSSTVLLSDAAAPVGLLGMDTRLGGFRV